VTVTVSTIAVAVSTICVVFVSTITDAVDPSLEDGEGIGVGTIAILGIEPRRT
jgi:hypothetical protein